MTKRRRRCGLWLVLGAGVLLITPDVVVAGVDQTLQGATDLVVAQVGRELAGTSFDGIKHVAVLPLAGDPEGYATSALKSVVTKTSYSLFTRDDETWDKLLAEIEWGVKREDVMDPETVQRFGQIKGIDAILYGRVWDRGVNMWNIRGHVKMSVHLAAVETGQILWSSGPLQAEAFMHWSDAVTDFWRFPLLILALLVVLAILAMILRSIKRSLRPL